MKNLLYLFLGLALFSCKDDSTENNVELLTEIFSQNKPEVVLIDYIQLMTGNRENLIKDWRS